MNVDTKGGVISAKDVLHEQNAYYEKEYMTTMARDAQRATDAEHRMTLMEGIRLYPKACAWSMLISACIIMEGFQVCLLGNFYGFPQFNKKYGRLLDDGTYQISAPWQAGLSNGANCGELIGLQIAGFTVERWGYKTTLVTCLALVTALIAIPFNAPNVQVLLVGEILMGIPWGVFQTVTISYASEIAPIALRAHLCTWVNCCWGIGQVIGVGVIKAMLNRDDEWSYRIPFALQWIWPVPLAIGIALAPAGPYWLVRHGKIDAAKAALLRLASPQASSDFNVDETVAMIRHVTELEKQTTEKASYWECFRGTNLRRTEIVCMAWMMQNLCGNSFSGYTTYFLEQGGLSPSYALNFTLGQYGINCVGVFGAWWLMARGIGRRTLFFYGLCYMFCILMVCGGMAPLSVHHKQAAGWATGVLMLLWACGYQLSVGTVAYSLVAEIPSRALAVKTVVLGRNAYNVVGIICSVLTPYMLNPSQWNWKQYTAWFWAGICLGCIVYTFFRMPEPRGRSYAELDVLFESGVPARKFSKAEVDLFGDVNTTTVEVRDEKRNSESVDDEKV